MCKSRFAKFVKPVSFARGIHIQSTVSSPCPLLSLPSFPYHYHLSLSLSLSLSLNGMECIGGASYQQRPLVLVVFCIVAVVVPHWRLDSDTNKQQTAYHYHYHYY